MKHIMLAKLAKKIEMFFSFPRLRTSVFFQLFYFLQTFCYLFSSRFCGCTFRFIIDENGIQDGFFYEIISLLGKPGIAWISMDINDNYTSKVFWKMKNWKMCLSFCFSCSSLANKCPISYKYRIIVATQTVIMYNTFFHI